MFALCFKFSKLDIPGSNPTRGQHFTILFLCLLKSHLDLGFALYGSFRVSIRVSLDIRKIVHIACCGLLTVRIAYKISL